MERNTRTCIQGVVVSNKNDKTIAVLVDTYRKHPKYGKRVKSGNKYYAHDENNEAQIGDTVTIMSCRRLSASKRFRLVSIDKKAVSNVKNDNLADEAVKEEPVAKEAE
jgi:small subunit ribosomal protein S17